MTSANQEPGALYWSVIEPYWDSLTGAWADVNDFLRVYRQAPQVVQHLYAAHWCQSEVCNGGLHQFFHNSTGILAPEAVVGFKAIGLKELASTVQEAMDYFGNTYPRERSARLMLLPDSPVGKRSSWDPFTALDDRFYGCIEAERNLWETRADRYAAVA
jgi:Domain of unknown function (DUF4375)